MQEEATARTEARKGDPKGGEPLDPVFYGPVTIAGRVIDERHHAVPGVGVECWPAGYAPCTARQLGRFLTRSDARGFFEFRDLPEADRYSLAAFAKHQHAHLTIHADQVRAANVELVLEEAAFERFVFEDPAGTPVDVRGIAPLAGGRWVWSSYDSTARARHWLRSLGLEPPPARSNEVVTVYRSARMLHRRVAGSLQVPAHKVAVPGYTETEVSPHRLPLSQWPRSTRVVLRPDASTWAGKVRYRFELPSLKAPLEWKGVDPVAHLVHIDLVVKEVNRNVTRRVTAASPIVYAPAGSRFEIRQWFRSPLLSYDTIQKGREIVVRPAYPKFGFVTLRYPVPPRSSAAGPGLHVFTHLGSEQVWGTRMYPGEARFGPLPIDEYQFGLAWSGLPIEGSSGCLGPVRVHEGLNVVTWR